MKVGIISESKVLRAYVEHKTEYEVVVNGDLAEMASVPGLKFLFVDLDQGPDFKVEELDSFLVDHLFLFTEKPKTLKKYREKISHSGKVEGLLKGPLSHELIREMIEEYGQVIPQRVEETKEQTSVTSKGLEFQVEQGEDMSKEEDDATAITQKSEVLQQAFDSVLEEDGKSDQSSSGNMLEFDLEETNNNLSLNEHSQSMETPQGEEATNMLTFDLDEESGDVSVEESSQVSDDINLSVEFNSGEEEAATQDESSAINLDITSDIEIPSEMNSEQEFGEVEFSDGPNDLSFDDDSQEISDLKTNLVAANVPDSADEVELSSEVESKADDFIIDSLAEELKEEAVDTKDSMRFQSLLRQVRQENGILNDELTKLQLEKRDFERENIRLKSELEDTRIELDITKKRFEKEMERFKSNRILASDKVKFFENKAKQLQEQLSKVSDKVRINLGQVKKRESELEGQLELSKLDAQSQIETRDKKIMELKRKIDALEFNMENASIHEQANKNKARALEEKLEFVVELLRKSLREIEKEVDTGESAPLEWKKSANYD